MPTSTNVTNLKINELTEAQYDTAVQGGVIGANELSILTDAEAGQVIQVATLPTASADELGNIYQFVGTTDANYTNGYFYKCTGAGEPVVYSWSRVDVQPGSSLPSQTGNAGKFLTTDGTDASWGNSTTESLYFKSSNSNMIGARIYSSGGQHLNIRPVKADGTDNGYGYTLGVSTFRAEGQDFSLGDNVSKWGTTYTKKINNGGNITVPTVAGSMAVQVSSLPTASSTLEGQIYQFVGTTDSTYTNGRFYKCVSDGQATPTYSWTEVSMGGLPSQTGNAGKFLTTDGTDASWGTISALQNTSNVSNALGIIGNAYGIQSTAVGATSVAYKLYSTALGSAAKAYSENMVAIGKGAGGYEENVNYSVAIGADAGIGSGAKGAIQLGKGTNSTAGTFAVGLTTNGTSWNQYEVVSADGTIPHARLTNAVQSTTVTIATTDWSSNTASVTVSGLTATSVVWVAPDNASQSAYTTAGVYASSQSADTLVFSCSTTPTTSLTVNIVWC